MADRPHVGVGVVIHDGQGNIVMGQRIGSHGAGTYQCPGGHLEHGESFAACAAREALEETGLEIGDVKFLVATNDVMNEVESKGGVGAEGKMLHYVTVYVTCRIVGENKVPVAMEPHKCAHWDWLPWSQMWAWAKAQAEAEDEGREVEKRMFRPLVNLYRQYPEFEFCLQVR